MSSAGAKAEEQNITTLGKQWPQSEYPKKSILLYDRVNDRYILAQADINGYLYVNAIIPGVILADVTDRWARELGQIDLVRVLGVNMAAANPVIAGIFDAAGNRMPSMDVAIRAGYVDVTDRWARTLGQFDLARVLGAALTVANPVITGVFDAAGNRLPTISPNTLNQGTRVTNAGVPIPISAASVPCYSVIVQAIPGNTASVFIGNNVAQPFELQPGDVVVIPIANVNIVYFDVTVNGEGVNWLAA